MSNDSNIEQGVLQASSGRRVQLTEKAREYQMDLKLNNYKKLLQKLKKSADIIFKDQDSADTDPDEQQLLQKIAAWSHDYVSFVQTNADLQSLLPMEKMASHNDSHTENLANINEAKMKMEKFRDELKKDARDEPDARDAASVVSQSSSVKESLQVLRLQSEHQKAGVAARLASLKRKQQLEKERQELQRQEEEFELQTQMAISEAQDEVTRRFEQELDGDAGTAALVPGHGPEGTVPFGVDAAAFVPMHMQEGQAPHGIRAAAPVSVHAPEGPVPDSIGAAASVPVHTQGQVHQGIRVAAPVSVQASEGPVPHSIGAASVPVHMQEVQAPHGIQAAALSVHAPEWPVPRGIGAAAQVQVNMTGSQVPHGITQDPLTQATVISLAEQLQRSQLPALEPEVFGGNVEQFSLWLMAFESYIEGRTNSSTERLHFLARYTKGEARDAIQGFLHLRTDEAYVGAKKKLMDRYGNDFVQVSAFQRRLREWPVIRAADGKSLRQLADFLDSCLAASQSVAGLSFLDDPNENKMILKKLPKYIVDRWKRIVDSRIYEPAPGTPGTYPLFCEFVTFLNREARVACGPVSSIQSTEEVVSTRTQPDRKQVPKDRQRAQAFLSAVNSDQEEASNTSRGENVTSQDTGRVSWTCKLCSERHGVDACDKFKNMTVAERHEVVKEQRLCRGCLKTGHRWRNCWKKSRCEICDGLHPSLLHDESLKRSGPHGVTGATARAQDGPAVRLPGTAANKPAVKTESTQTRATSLQVTVGSDGGESVSCFHAMIVPVLLHQEDKPEHQEIVYALLDPQSDACFVSDSTMKKVGASGEQVFLELSTMTGKTTVTSTAVKGLVVQPLDGNTQIELPASYSRAEIPAERSLIPRRETTARWSHLKDVARELPEYQEDAEIGILIGMNCPRAVKPRDVVTGESDDPWAVKTELGWSVVGLVRGAAGAATCHRVSVETDVSKTCHFAFKVHAQEVSPMQVAKLFDQDFEVCLSEQKLSIEDRQFLKIMEDEIHQRDDGHFEAPLPLKNPEIKLPNNKHMAMQRLAGLRKRLTRDQEFRKDYGIFMDEMLEKGYAEPVPDEELQLQDGKVWFVPHHGIYHKKKKKIRVVFDCSAEYEGHSLNSQLLQGPDHANNLTGVLLRFRKGPVALSCDIEGMFNQVGVNTEHRNLLRFLWWKDGKFETEPAEFRMTTHLFGATSSPACAMYALNTTADKYDHLHGTEPADFVRNDFYVDDGLTSTCDAEAAVRLIEDTVNLCADGGFRLHKFVCNDPEVLEKIPLEIRSKNLQSVDVKHELRDDPLFERALGVRWSVAKDTLHFDVQLPERPDTRRGILSTVSSLYDPLGLISPFVLQGKNILKQLCCDGMSWDETVPEEIKNTWNMWKKDIQLLSEISVPRCYIPRGYDRVKSYELHHFSDASMEGCGQCSYLRVILEDGRVSSSLVMSKAKVTPKKTVTVPRLELAAAVMSVKASCFLRRELHISDLREFFWCDSMVVLGYIHNESRRFHVFVANRVQQIREHSSPGQWRYVKSEENPSDLASRGLIARDLQVSELWWHGPAFLSESSELPEVAEVTQVQSEDPEVKSSMVLVTGIKTDSQVCADLPERLKYFSSWFKAKRAVAICLRYKRRLIRQVREKKGLTAQQDESFGVSLSDALISTEDLKEAEIVILKSVQKEVFEEEVDTLTTVRSSEDATSVSNKNRALKKQSDLYRLDPYMGEDGLLRVGGRVQNSGQPDEVTHPVIMPKRGHVTELIVSHFHEKSAHSGRELTLSEIRLSGFWIIRGRSAVARHILECIKCKKLRGTPCAQKMASLPAERLIEVEPFVNCGVDYFGPFYVQERRSQVKRWGVMFTCFSSRAIHLETANSMTADSFLNAYRRFASRRGPVKRLYCDQGTNFIGGRGLLEAALKEMDHDRIRQELLKEQCDWIEFRMNVPKASHMGGVWERQIRSARTALNGLLQSHGQHLDDELLRTVMAEAEAIVNSRPLSYCSMTHTDLVEPITFLLHFFALIV